jgi:hypothetical protein
MLLDVNEANGGKNSIPALVIYEYGYLIREMMFWEAPRPKKIFLKISRAATLSQHNQKTQMANPQDQKGFYTSCGVGIGDT